jgi:type VI secretion system protein ImpK
MLQTDPDRRIAAGGAGRGDRAPQRWSVVALQAVGETPAVERSEADEGPFDPHTSYLLGAFRAFYAELARLRALAVRDPSAVLGTADGTPSSIDARDVAQAVRRRLQHVLEQLALESGARTGEIGAVRFRDAQYAMAALADEVLLHTDWVGREAWLDTLLERVLFGSQLAGEEVFRRIDALLEVRTGASVDLAAVYFMILGLGFEGQYRGLDGSLLGGYRLRLYRFLYRRDVGTTRGPLVPQAYAHTAVGRRPPRLALVQRWMLYLVVAIVAYLVGSEVIWRRLSAGVRATSSEILRQAHQSAAPE